MNIHMPFATMHPIAGHLAGPASYTSADININWHLIPLGDLACRDLELRYLGLIIGKF
jgi:hypothetical protein